MQLTLALDDVVPCPACSRPANRVLVTKQGCCYACFLAAIDAA